MNWSPQQDAALRAVDAWIKDPHAPQVFRIFGYAGTGKTTLAKEIAANVDGEVLFMAFTGKAALVLRKKGCDGASTIHSAIYKPLVNEETGEVAFVKNYESAVSEAELVIVDEVGMLDETIGQDLLSFGTKILVLGDPYQLPPIKGTGFFTSDAPDVMLTEIHRQAQDNPIIRLSMAIRTGSPINYGMHGESRVVPRAALGQDELDAILKASDQVLCGRNATRQSLNATMRRLEGLQGDPQEWMPVAGDKVVCLRNNREKGLLNGSLWRVDSVREAGAKFNLRVLSLDEPHRKFPVKIGVLSAFWRGEEDKLDWKEKRGTEEFTYGNALTVHKAQGSQWDNVVVFDECRCFRESATNHLYTAVTRAAQQVTLIV